MSALQLISVIVSSLVLGAHFLRDGPILLTVLSLLFPALLFIKRAWAARLVQFILILVHNQEDNLELAIQGKTG